MALIPLEDLRLLEELEDKLDAEQALIALEEAKEQGMVPFEVVKRELGL